MIYNFTICIPTFNRGERALELVNTVLPNLEENWSLMVLNNNSFDGTEFYDKIEELGREHSNLEYIFIMCQSIGFPPISTIGFGLISVSSERRVPNPPANNSTFIFYLFSFFKYLFVYNLKILKKGFK